VTGPPGPHNPRAQDYVSDLKTLTHDLDLDESVCLLFEMQPAPELGAYAIDASTLSDLYMLCDVVTLPSTSEGFGLPLAEAALFRAPVVCTDLPAFREVSSTGPRFVAVSAGSAGFTSAVLAALNEDRVKMRRRILHDLSWDNIIQEHLEPLLTSR
jgi:glycosyltransferase involved in cell wall biosynthesis